MKPLSSSLSASWYGAVVCAGVLFLAACDSPERADTAPPADGAAVNTLTDAERAEGWTLLFDGQNLDGWRGYGADAFPSQWTIEDGALHYDSSAAGTGGDIITAQPYDDFELSLEWKIAACGNSGIFYRVVEDERYDAVYHTGPEYQVLDNTCHPDAQNGANRTAAANYDLIAPSQDATKPAGQWNQTRIVVDSAHVEHWLNGQKVVEYELWGDEWNQLVAGSKFVEWPDYGLAREGHIALQDHDDEVWYRNIKIRPLD